MKSILSGMKVLDFGRYIAGPYCAAILADLGADVIRIEQPGGADDRYLMPITADGEGALFLQSNRGKRSLTLDVTKPEGRSVMERLVATADIVIANAPPKALTQMGLSYEQLKAIKPDIILTSAGAYDAQSALANASGFDGTGQALSGAMFLSGPPGQPYRAATSYVDFSTAISCAYGTLAAVIHRLKTGEGTFVEASLVNTALNMVTPILMEEATGARHRAPTANRSPIAGPSDLFATTDGWVLVQVIGQGMFRRWAALVDREDLLDNPRFTTDILRGDNGAELSEIMGAWCAPRTIADVLSALRGARIPATHLLQPAQVLDPANGLRDTLGWMKYDGLSQTVPLAQSPAIIGGARVTEVAPAPLLGAHSAEVLTEAGLSADEIAALRVAGII